MSKFNHTDFKTLTDFMLLADVATCLQISQASLRNRLCNNPSSLPPSFKTGRLRLFPRAEFEAWLLNRMQGKTAKGAINHE